MISLVVVVVGLGAVVEEGDELAVAVSLDTVEPVGFELDVAAVMGMLSSYIL